MVRGVSGDLSLGVGGIFILLLCSKKMITNKGGTIWHQKSLGQTINLKKERKKLFMNHFCNSSKCSNNNINGKGFISIS